VILPIFYRDFNTYLNIDKCCLLGIIWAGVEAVHENSYDKNDMKHVFIANFMKNPKHQLSPINFIFFNQMTKTDFCSSPALKQKLEGGSVKFVTPAPKHKGK